MSKLLLFFLMSGGAHEYVAKINGKYRGLT